VQQYTAVLEAASQLHGKYGLVEMLADCRFKLRGTDEEMANWSRCGVLPQRLSERN
jgi:hypothetical protein